jgi:hypothetical protein
MHIEKDQVWIAVITTSIGIKHTVGYWFAKPNREVVAKEVRDLVGNDEWSCEITQLKPASSQPEVVYDPNFGDDKVCQCGHPYYRHFDTYEDMYPVGCKYCGCDRFH